jgi:methanogenic corrinoid protein MtbC1
MDLKTIFQNVIDGETEEVEAGVKTALAEGTGASIILNQALIAAMDEVGGLKRVIYLSLKCWPLRVPCKPVCNI